MGEFTNDMLNEILDTCRVDEAENERLELRERVRKGDCVSYEDRDWVFNDEMNGKTRQATKNDYMKWLKGFLEGGGNVTHVYDYNMPLDKWLVVSEDFEILPLYGSRSNGIIVENNVEVEYGSEGHNNLYFMDGGVSPNFVPIYSDIVFGEIENESVNEDVYVKPLSIIGRIKEALHI